jgi:hypothetical protein
VQISGLPILSITTSQGPRPDVVERLQRQGNRSEDDSSSFTRPSSQPDSATLAQLRPASENTRQQRVESSVRASELVSRRRPEDENLPFNTQRALRAFTQNSPSPEQQLGIELAGIDIFA